MGRVERESNNKSHIRHELADMFPDHFKTGKAIGGFPSIVFIDMLQYIKNVRPSEIAQEDNEEDNPNSFYDGSNGFDPSVGISKYGGAISYLVSVIKSALNRSIPVDMPNNLPVVCVIAIDKYDYVCPARSIVHRKRAVKKKIVNGVEVVEEIKHINPGEFEYPQLDDKIEFAFDDITKDKRHNSRVLFSFLVTNIINKLKKKPMAREIQFVFEGHCIDKETVFLIDDLIDQKIPENAYSTPIALNNIGDGTFSASWMYAFENDIGESDFVAFFYLKKAHNFCWETADASNCWHLNLDHTLHLYSTDTDCMIYSLIFKSQRQSQKFANDHIVMMYEKICKHKESKWINIDGLFNDIDSRLAKTGGSSVMHPVLQLCIAAISGGSDYTECFEQVPHKYFLRAYLNFPDLIGNLVDIKREDKNNAKNIYNMRVNSRGYVKFICLAYIQSKSTTKLWKEFDPFSDDIGYNSILEKLVLNYPSSEKFWLPTQRDMVYQACQLQYYINMISRIGKRSVDIELKESSIEKYSFKVIKTDGQPDKFARLIHKRTQEDIRDLTSKYTGRSLKRKMKSKNGDQNKKSKTIFPD